MFASLQIIRASNSRKTISLIYDTNSHTEREKLLSKIFYRKLTIVSRDEKHFFADFFLRQTVREVMGIYERMRIKDKDKRGVKVSSSRGV